MRVVRGRDVQELTRGELCGRLRGCAGLTIDVGTGDGRFAYACARQRPDRLVVGMDPAREQLRETSSRAMRKPSRGGLPNVLFVWAGAEQPPAELLGLAGEVYVILPWGKLMVGLVLAQADVLGGLRSLAAPGAVLRFVLGADVWADPVPVELHDLPEVTVEYVERALAPAYAEQGLRITTARPLTNDEIARIPSTWARRLAHGRERPRFFGLEAVLTTAGPR